MRWTYLPEGIKMCTGGIALCVGTALAGWLPGPAQGQTLPTEEHPSLLFTADQIPVLKERIQREPYATWWQIVLDRAESVPSSIAAERTKARFAKSLAFAYLMTDDPGYARQAVELLLDMRFPPRGGDLGEPHNEGEVVALYALAYDMIHNFVQDDAAALEEIRTILAEEAQRIHDGIVIQEIDLGFTTLKIRLDNTPDPRDLSGNTLHLNNWHVRAYGGLGMAAFALSDHPGGDDTPQEWADQAFDLVTRSLWHQIDEIDGGYAEGPFYSRYAADVYLPYMFALKKLTGVNLFVDATIQKMHDWSLNLRLPNGKRPNTDDGHLDDFYGHYLSAVYANGGVNRWDWENNVDGLYVREFSEMDAIALYDDRVAAQEPAHGPTIFMPAAGDAVFRSDWSTGATYMLLRGEHGRARAQGLAHEHPDETSFIIYAGGEMLALDAGYINFANHDKVNRGRNHNVILVDGEGPPLYVVPLLGQAIDGGNDAFIEEFFTSDFMDYAEVRAAYSGVDIRRRVMFPGKAYFVVADELMDDQTHHYEWRLHGHGGGRSGGAYERTGNLARWTRTRAELLAYMPDGGGLAFSERDTLHSFDFLEEPTHTMLLVEQTGANAEFLTILYPRSLDQAEPAFSGIEARGGKVAQLELGQRQDLAWVQTATAAHIVFSGPAGSLDSDGRFGFVRYEGGRLGGFNVQDGSYLNSGGKAIFSASQAVDFSLAITPTTVEGFVRGPDAGYQVSIAMLGSVEEVKFDGILVDMALENDILTLALEGEGALSLAQDTAILDGRAARPARFQLLQNYPNPFNVQTSIVYQVAQDTRIRLSIYNLAGQQVQRLVDQIQPAGAYRVFWDGTDAAGKAVGSGVYIYRLQAGEKQLTRRLLLLK